MIQQDKNIVDAALPCTLVAHYQTTQPVVNGQTAKVNVAIVDTTRLTVNLTPQQLAIVIADAKNVMP